MVYEMLYDYWVSKDFLIGNTVGSRFAMVCSMTIHSTTLVESEQTLPTCGASLS